MMKSICVLFAVIAVSRVAADGGPDHGKHSEWTVAPCSSPTPRVLAAWAGTCVSSIL